MVRWKLLFPRWETRGNQNADARFKSMHIPTAGVQHPTQIHYPWTELSAQHERPEDHFCIENSTSTTPNTLPTSCQEETTPTLVRKDYSVPVVGPARVGWEACHVKMLILQLEIDNVRGQRELHLFPEVIADWRVTK